MTMEIWNLPAPKIERELKGILTQRRRDAEPEKNFAESTRKIPLCSSLLRASASLR
jgi:hypothetical protein